MQFAASYLWFLAPALMGLGALTGFLSGLLGIGGGIILVPCLYYLFVHLGFAPQELMHVAIGTSHAIMAVTVVASSRAHAKRGGIDKTILPALGAGIVCGVAAATLVVNHLDGAALKILFSVMIAGLAVLMVVDAEKFVLFREMPGRKTNLAAGGVIGAVAGILGIGGAVLSVPYMTQCRLPIRRAVGTATVLGLFITIPATLGFILMGLEAPARPPYSLGYINIAAWALIAPVSIFSAPWGAKAAHTLPVKKLRYIFAAVMVAVSANMMFDVLHG